MNNSSYPHSYLLLYSLIVVAFIIFCCFLYSKIKVFEKIVEKKPSLLRLGLLMVFILILEGSQILTSFFTGHSEHTPIPYYILPPSFLIALEMILEYLGKK
jgi:hypothetical protein